MKTKKILARAMFAVFILALACPAFAAEYRVGGNWLTEGEGFGEKGIVRIELYNKGRLTFYSTISNDVSGDYEILTGYDMYGELEATDLGIKVWSDSDSHTYDTPIILPPNFNPSMSDPFSFPDITIDDITYTLTLTSASSGTLSVRGYVDVDSIGRCEIKGDNALWKEGTDKPDSPDSGSGCSAFGIGAASLLVLALGLALKRKKSE